MFLQLHLFTFISTAQPQRAVCVRYFVDEEIQELLRKSDYNEGDSDGEAQLFHRCHFAILASSQLFVNALTVSLVVISATFCLVNLILN